MNANKKKKASGSPRPSVVRETAAPYGDHLAEAERIHTAALRRLGPSGRLKQTFEMYEFARNLIRGALRTQHPAWPNARIETEVRRRMTGA